MTVSEFFRPIGEWLYRFLYITGVETVCFLRRLGQTLVQRARPFLRDVYRVADRLLLQYLRRFWAELCSIGSGLRGIPSYLAEYKGAARVKAFFSLPVMGAKNHAHALRTVFNWLAPVAGIVLLCLCIGYWRDCRFALEVIYRGDPIGYIGDQIVYDDAADLAMGRVINNDGTFTVDRVPGLSLAAVSPEDLLLDKEALCDNILRTAGDSIVEMTGLYVDDHFEGAVVSRNELMALLREIKEPFLTGAENERAEFVQDVRAVDGLYPVSSLIDIGELRERLNQLETVATYYTVVRGDNLVKVARAHNMPIEDLRALNPTVKNDYLVVGQQLLIQQPQAYLRVQVVRTLYYAEDIPFAIEKSYNTNKNVMYERVIRAGVKGSQDVTEEITYRDGVEVSRVITETVMTKEPTTKLVEVGTQPVRSSAGTDIVQGDGIATGTMLWPVPSCRYMSRGYFSGHGGIDISNGPVPVNKKPFVAADGGVVSRINTSGYGGGYGLYVVIDHGNGLETGYAHCSSLCVVLGQKVSKGQKLGTVGSTGRSTGPHLHFEVTVNKRRVNPLNYVNPKR